MTSLYPDGYRDPEWDGSEEQFRDIVVPARIAAIEQGISERFAGVLPEGVRFEWASDADAIKASVKAAGFGPVPERITVTCDRASGEEEA